MEPTAALRVFFGHQSVGVNIIDAMNRVSGVRLRTPLLTAVAADSLAKPALGHAFLGQNGEPLTKLAAFEQALARLNGQVDAAFFKFCYVDFTASTDVGALFLAYEAAFARLRAAYPHVVFVHVTAPLTVVQSGLKAWVKRRLGRSPWGLRENVVRHAFNERLRAAHRGEPVFDLALVESRRDDGGLDTFPVAGAAIPRLRADFTDDGGHLNVRGADAAARALLQVLGTLQPAERVG